MHRFRSLLLALKPTRLSVLFAVLIGVGVGFWQWGKPPLPRVALVRLGGSHQHSIFSADGKTLSITHWSDPHWTKNCLTLWDVASGEIKALDSRAYPMATFSPDGKKMACRVWPQSDLQTHISVWDVESGQELVSYADCLRRGYWRLIFSRAGNLLALGEKSVLWDLANDTFVNLVGSAEELMAWGFSAILVMESSGKVKVWDLNSAALWAHSKNIPNPIENPAFGHVSVELSPDRRLLLYQNESVVIVYNRQKDEQRVFPKTDGQAITGADITPDGATVALAMKAKTAPKKSLCCSFLEYLAIQPSSSENRVVLKTISSGEEVAVLDNCASPTFSPDGNSLAVISTSGSPELWDFPIRKPIGKILAQAGLAALVTLLALKTLGWLRRRRTQQLTWNQPESMGQ